MLSSGSGLSDDPIVHLLPHLGLGSFWQHFEALVEDVINEVLLEYFEVVFQDFEDVVDS